VNVSAKLRGVEAGGGAWGFGDFTSAMTIGEKHLSVVDVASHMMQVFQNDQLVQTWPISAGRANLPTIGGTLYVPYKSQDVKMDSLTLGIPRNSPDGYFDHVYWNTAISFNGFYIHAAPWDIAQQGVENVSHGCVNISPDRATTFFHFSQVGDIVQVKNSPRVADAGDGEGDWQIPFAQWANSGGALETAPNHAAGGF
jgi:lipoprotein-anchoring transpeptidase ErfK/SrfK